MTIIRDTGLLLPEDSENKLAWFEDDYRLYGYIDKDGKVIIPPKYQSASHFKNINGKLRAIVGVDETGGIFGYGYRLINEKGEKVSGFYSEMKFVGDLIVVKRGGRYGTIDENGKVREYYVYNSIRNGIGKIIYKTGKLKGYENYYFLKDGEVKRANYGKAISKASFMSTQALPVNEDNSINVKKKLLYFRHDCQYDKEVYVNLNTNDVLDEYEVVTNFKEIDDKKTNTKFLRAVALHKKNNQICVIDEYGRRVIQFSSDKCMIVETRNDMYMVIDKKTGFRKLYNLNGYLIINESADINIMPCGLILVKNKQGINYIFTTEGLLLRTFVDYIYINGNKNDKFLVANYINENDRKSELIDDCGNAIKFNFDYDYANEVVGGYTVLSKKEIDYSMNSPYEYKKQYIVDTNKNIIQTYPKDDLLSSFSFIQNYADKGFFIGDYQNINRYSVFDLNGKVLFELECDYLEYENGLFIAKFDSDKYYKFYDINGSNLFDEEYTDCYDDCFDYYKFIGEKSLIVYRGRRSYFVNLEDKNVYIHGWQYEDSRVLSEMLRTKDIFLIEDKSNDEFQVSSYHVVYKKPYMLEITYPHKFAIFDNYEDHRIIKEEYRDLLMYFNLSEEDFSNVDIRGIDFSKTNAIIDPFIVYNCSLDDCILRKDNIKNYYALKLFKDFKYLYENNGLKEISLKNTIIDNILLNEEGQKLILHSNNY